MEAVEKDLEECKKIGLILPTGAGKTEIFVELGQKLIEKNPDEIVLVLSHLSLLTTQTRDRFKERYPNIPIGVLQGNTYPEEGSKVVVSTMQSSRVRDKVLGWLAGENLNNKITKHVGTIIVDESHYIETKSYQQILKYFPKANIIGVTATPYRDAKLMTDFFDKISFTISMQELINRGYLVPLKLNQIIMESDADVNERIARVLALYLKNEKGKKAVVFMNTIEDARTCRNAFKDAGIKAKDVTSEITGEYRDKVLDKFRNGDLNVLVTVNVLSAGFDAKCLEAIFMPYSTTSPTLFMQRIGRGSRIFQGKEDCRVYCFGSAPRIKKGFYKRLEHMALYGGDKKEKPDIFDELDFMELTGIDKTNDTYVWTKQIADISARLKELNKLELYDLMRQKKFPQRYLRNLTILKRGIEDLEEDCVEAVIRNVKKIYVNEDKWLMPSGRFIGRHVKELPYKYWKYVIENQPDSHIGKLCKLWYYYKKRD